MKQLIARHSTVCIFLLAPFAIASLLQEKWWLGAWTSFIVSIFAVNLWAIIYQDRYFPKMVRFVLAPAIIIFSGVCLMTLEMMGVFWLYPIIVSFYFLLKRQDAWIANILVMCFAIPFVSIHFDAAYAIRIVTSLVMISIFSAIFTQLISAQEARLKALIVTDHLTGLYNRSLLNERLSEAIQQYNRSRAPMTLITMDLDHFKTINDQYGHIAGDRVLKKVSEVLIRRSREVDTIFRTGGEEFLVVLYNTDLEQGIRAAESYLRLIAATQCIPQKTVTMSAGVATLKEDESAEQWMLRSDNSLYKAKDAGRNCVIADCDA